MTLEDRLKLLNALKEQLGLIEGNLTVLMEGLEAEEELAALSDCREAASRIHGLLDRLEQSTGDEITLEMCKHGMKVSREVASLGTRHCECCGMATFRKLCAVCAQPPPAAA